MPLQWQPTPVLLPGKSHGRRSLEGCSPWGRYKSDTTEQLHFHFPLSCIGEGNSNPLQCSCLESPRDGGAWWAAVYGVAQSRTRLKRLSSSSSSKMREISLIIHFFKKYWLLHQVKPRPMCSRALHGVRAKVQGSCGKWREWRKTRKDPWGKGRGEER